MAATSALSVLFTQIVPEEFADVWGIEKQPKMKQLQQWMSQLKDDVGEERCDKRQQILAEKFATCASKHLLQKGFASFFANCTLKTHDIMPGLKLYFCVIFANLARRRRFEWDS